MRRVLITGASGFAGGWLARACAREGDHVIGVSRSGDTPSGEGVKLDLADAKALARLIEDANPDVVYHLAAQSHVGISWEQPAETIETNMAGAVNLLEAIRHATAKPRVVWASTCEVYGDGVGLTEEAPLNPKTPYAISKTAGEQLAELYADKYGLEIVRARPFNHAGPGQQPNFLISSLAQQAAQAKLDHKSHLKIMTGNPDSRRDFTDVRDVARAYRLLASNTGETGQTGERVPLGAYNISTGHSISVAENVQTIAELIAPIEVEHVVDPARVRAGEVLDRSGSSAKLQATTGWEPEIPIRTTIADAIDWWQQRLDPLVGASTAPTSGTIHRAPNASS